MESVFLGINTKTKSSQAQKTMDHYHSCTDIKVFEELLADQIKNKSIKK